MRESSAPKNNMGQLKDSHYGSKWKNLECFCGDHGTRNDLTPSQPMENRNAAQISRVRTLLSPATRFHKRCRETVTILCKFTAHGAFMPSDSSSVISDGTPRIVDVIGATVTVDKVCHGAFTS